MPEACNQVDPEKPSFVDPTDKSPLGELIRGHSLYGPELLCAALEILVHPLGDVTQEPVDQ